MDAQGIREDPSCDWAGKCVGGGVKDGLSGLSGRRQQRAELQPLIDATHPTHPESSHDPCSGLYASEFSAICLSSPTLSRLTCLSVSFSPTFHRTLLLAPYATLQFYGNLAVKTIGGDPNRPAALPLPGEDRVVLSILTRCHATSRALPMRRAIHVPNCLYSLSRLCHSRTGRVSPVDLPCKSEDMKTYICTMPESQALFASNVRHHNPLERDPSSSIMFVSKGCFQCN
ncbi:hypothetical protein BDP55DRAFT_633665 [Colletotrichum godetiae]|uniref:Uncharacterized protein n=1 Tax=Colletotrichum godetiae TaxID=1209918 RepID=A0AAJ0AGY8_9PEZI|nr:uncharacterized protein BDP55DRAFT_633665 [Colletotrichum godetiae]KAK1673713.1 hypothetical protein BDP55DRAFT_633665 [Colletotrichum godetiae]